MKLLRTLAIIGNIVFILWMLWNAVDERGQGVRPVEAASLMGLIALLGLNTYLLTRKDGRAILPPWNG